MIHWSLIAFGVAVYIAVVAWALSPTARKRGLGVSLCIGFMALSYGLAIEILGQPKPLILEWRDMEGLEIGGLAPSSDGHTVYVWVMRDGVPISYSLEAGDGDQKRKVAEILDHWRRRQQTGEQFVMTGQDNNDQGPHMRIEPPPPQPPKE